MKLPKCFLFSNIKTKFTKLIIHVIIKQKGKKEDIALVFFYLPENAMDTYLLLVVLLFEIMWLLFHALHNLFKNAFFIKLFLKLFT